MMSCSWDFEYHLEKVVLGHYVNIYIYIISKVYIYIYCKYIYIYTSQVYIYIFIIFQHCDHVLFFWVGCCSIGTFAVKAFGFDQRWGFFMLGLELHGERKSNG